MGYIKNSHFLALLHNDLSACLSIGNNWQFAFHVKFYPPDPSLLTEDITRYTHTHTHTHQGLTPSVSLKFITFYLC